MYFTYGSEEKSSCSFYTSCSMCKPTLNTRAGSTLTSISHFQDLTAKGGHTVSHQQNLPRVIPSLPEGKRRHSGSRVTNHCAQPLGRNCFRGTYPGPTAPGACCKGAFHLMGNGGKALCSCHVPGMRTGDQMWPCQDGTAAICLEKGTVRQ